MIEKEFDLHNYLLLTPEDVEFFVNKIIQECYDEKINILRIITGRGAHSKNPPMIKQNTIKTLKKNKLISKYLIEETMGSFVIFLVN